MDSLPTLSVFPPEAIAIIELLRSENQTLKARVAELERQLNQNSGNSSKPPSSDGFRKPPKPTSLRQKSGKPSGGQKGHAPHRLEPTPTPDTIIDHLPEAFQGCTCGTTPTLADSIFVSSRQIFDTPPPPPLHVTEHRIHTCRCPKCGKKAMATAPEWAITKAQYGPNILGMAAYLNVWQLLPERRSAQVISDLLGVKLAPATVASHVQRLAARGKAVYEALREKVRNAAVKHADETSVGNLWLHVLSTAYETVYRFSAKRGDIDDQVKGILMRDHFAPYNKLKGVEHAFCNSHHQREFMGVQLDGEAWASEAFDLFQRMCHAVNEAQRAEKTALPLEDVAAFEAAFDRVLAAGLAYHESLPPFEKPSDVLKGKRGRPAKRKGYNLLLRLQKERIGVLRFLSDFRVPFTNNQAERDIRMMKVRKKVSGSFRSKTAADGYATVRSILDTARKKGWGILQTLLEDTQTTIQKIQEAPA
jgi:transposase